MPRKFLSQELVTLRFKEKRLSILSKYRNNFSKVRVECFCGNKFSVSPYHVFNDSTQSCGCLVGKKKPYRGYEGLPYRYFANVRRHARTKNRKFTLSMKDIWTIYLSQDKKCALSGMDIKFAKTYRNDADEQTASVDRIDSSKGYIKGNIQIVHKTVNLMKNNMSDKKFIDICKIISKFRK